MHINCVFTKVTQAFNQSYTCEFDTLALNWSVNVQCWSGRNTCLCCQYANGIAVAINMVITKGSAFTLNLDLVACFIAIIRISVFCVVVTHIFYFVVVKINGMLNGFVTAIWIVSRQTQHNGFSSRSGTQCKNRITITNKTFLRKSIGIPRVVVHFLFNGIPLKCIANHN